MGKNGKVGGLRNEENLNWLPWRLAENLKELLDGPGGPVTVRDHELVVAQP